MKIYREADLKDLFQIQDKKARALMRADGFPSKKIGNTYVVEEEDLKKWLDSIEEVKLDYRGV